MQVLNKMFSHLFLLSATYPDRVYRVDVAQVIYASHIADFTFVYWITVNWWLIDGTFLQEKIYNVVDILEDGIFIVDLKDDSLK